MMNDVSFFITIDLQRSSVVSKAHLEQIVFEALSKTDLRQISLEIVHPKEVRLWEKILYPLLGLTIPEDTTCLLGTFGSGVVCVSFESGDGFWEADYPMRKTRNIQMTLPTGEIFIPRSTACIPREDFIPAALEFYGSREMPSSIRWRRLE